MLSRRSAVYFGKSVKIALKELDLLINFLKNERQDCLWNFSQVIKYHDKLIFSRYSALHW